jgi:hypothetical protein
MAHIEGRDRWRLSLFGALTIASPDGSVFRTDRLKAAELLAFLALRRAPVVDRDTVVGALWPEADFDVGRNRLKQTLAVLRKDIPEIPILTHGKNGVELDRGQVEIDFETIESRMKWLHALQPHERADAARQMWESVRQGLLPELRLEWILPEQSRVDELARQLREEFERLSGTARASFRFGDKFGGAHVPLTGRKSELGFIDAWLATPAVRPLLLVGPPGVGKTRLLHEALSQEANSCDAVIMLSTVQASEAPWLERIGQLIGIRGKQEVTESLVRLLRGFSRPLISIDDFDQADEEMRRWLVNICVLVPHLKVVGTARWRDPDADAEFLDVHPLNTDASPRSEAGDLLTTFAVHFGVPLHQLDQHVSALAEIASSLQGLPLALEVAAGWLPYMLPDRLLSQLRSSMSLVIERRALQHDSLRECVRVVCRSLPEVEADALRCLSICRGGCGEELAEQMFGPEWAWRVRALNERSLLFRVLGKRGNRFVSLQAIRQCVESIESIESPGKMSDAQNLHQAACLQLAERAAWEISEGERAGWLDFMRDEGDNILLACSRNLSEPQTLERSIRLLHLLRAGFYLIRRTSEFSKVYADLCAKAIERYPKLDCEMPMAALQARVRALPDAGKLQAAIEMATRYRESAESANRDPFGIADAYDFESDCRLACDDVAGALHCALQAAVFFSRAGYVRHALWMESKIGGCERRLGRGEEAARRRLRALERAVEIKDHNSVGMIKKQLAKIAYLNGAWPDAVLLGRESVQAFILAGESTTTFDAYLVLAAGYVAGGDRKSALAALSESNAFANLSDPKSLPDYDRLMDAALHGASIDLNEIDRR